jgi:uncharacterized membrane protein
MKRKPSQSTQFDLNAVPAEPRNWFVGILYFLSTCAGLISLFTFAAWIMTMKVGDEKAILLQWSVQSFTTCVFFGVVGQILRYVHYMCELAEWRAERDLVESQRHDYNQR